MAALTADRNTVRREIEVRSEPVKASTKIYGGSIVMLDASGWAVPATAAVSLIPAGIATGQADNSAGANGDKNVECRFGAFKLGNGDTITKADIGKLAFAFDDQTVKKAAAGLSPIGTIVDVDSDGVWVDVRPRRPSDAANPDTSGATLANVEIEVNEMKATLRNFGLIAA